MQTFNPNWLLRLKEEGDKPEGGAVEKNAGLPFFPWLTPLCPFGLREAVLSLGRVRTLSSGEYIFPKGEKVDKLVLLLEGVTARSLETSSGIESQGIGIATPGRLAAGNLNFWSGRFAFGNYFALSEAVVGEVSSLVLKNFLKRNPEVLFSALALFEGCTLSDRMVFATRGIIDLEERVKVLLCAWACTYGKLARNGEGLKIATLALPPLFITARLLNANALRLERILENWSRTGALKMKGEELLIEPGFLNGAYHWLMRVGKEGCGFAFPPDIKNYFF